MPIAYLHGFASSARSRKGLHLATVLEERGLTLQRPELNQPSFARLTISGALAAVDALAATAPDATWRFIGSSMGGYVAARWAQLHPERVDRLLLLCPGFGLLERWPQMLGAEAFAQWEATGQHAFADATGEPVEVHWGFIQDLRLHPPTPEVGCPTRIVHGRLDAVVPVESSRRYAAMRPHVALVEVDDDHPLTRSLPRITAEVLDFLL